jgi:ABC-2 type transport system permease protein
MSKISLIIQREYLTRVKKKSFIIMTFLTPVLFAALVIVPIWLTQAMKDKEKKEIAVVDNSGLYRDVLTNRESITFTYVDDSFERLQEEKSTNGYYAILHITGDLSQNPGNIFLYSEKQVNLEIRQMIGRQLEKFIVEEKKKSSGIENIDEILASFKTDVNINSIKWGKDGKARESAVESAMIVGFIGAFVIYMFIFMYGVQVMRGVIEEKTNRIVEVIISSVKPFQLMMGKVIGIALVGLTQFLMWVVLSGTLIFVVQTIFLPDIKPDEALAMQQSPVMQMQGADAAPLSPDAMKMINSFFAINFGELLIYFLLYFMGGYLLYAAMFAAIGSAVDNETDTQQFMMPVTIPMIFAIYVAMSAINNPHGPLAFWCSIIPFTSPVVMMVRIPFEVPLWEKLLSVGLLIITFIGMIWVASKIYRTGILMYGKKVTFKEMIKWLTFKG